MPNADPTPGTPGTATASEFDPGLPFEDEAAQEPEENPETEAPAAPTEGTVESEAAEASKKPADGTAAEPAAPATDDDAPDLSDIPEQYRETVRKYGDTRVSKLQSSWQDRLEKAAALDKFNERFEKEPEALRRDFEALYEKTHGKPAAPPKASAPDIPADPGDDIPDPVEDPKGFKAYWVASKRWNDHRLEKAVAEREQQVRKEIEPAVALARRAAAVEKVKSIQDGIKATDEEMAEVLRLADEARTDASKGFSIIAEVVRLRKEVATAKAKNGKAAAEAARGMEEKPGLPRTGAVRQKPKPTGNLTRDIAAELAHEGVAYPGEE